MNSSCVSCHDGNTEFSLKTYNDCLKYVVPGNSAQSRLVTTTQPGGEMAKYCATIDAQTIKTWVDQGAKQ